MSVGTSVPLPAYTIDPAFMARKAEELGFDSIWYAEHPVLPVNSKSQFPNGGPIPETYAGKLALRPDTLGCWRPSRPDPSRTGAHIFFRRHPTRFR